MKKDGCPYCHKGDALAKFGVLAFETEKSEVIVFKDQTYEGRVIVAWKDEHVAELKDLSDADRNVFMKDVADVANAIAKAYNPSRINYGAFGDTLGHLHIHIVPKYEGKEDWGGMFVMNHGEKSYASEEKINEVIANLKKYYKA